MPIANADAIHRVWDELSDHDASQPELALRHLMEFLAGLGNVSNVTWTAGIRMGGIEGQAGADPLQEWRVAAVKTLRPVAPTIFCAPGIGARSIRLSCCPCGTSEPSGPTRSAASCRLRGSSSPFIASSIWRGASTTPPSLGLRVSS